MNVVTDRYQLFWSIPAAKLIELLETTSDGLSENKAQERFLQSNSLISGSTGAINELRLFISQFKSPIMLMLLAAAVLSFILSDSTDTLIILFIVTVSGILGFWQERGAAYAVQKLLSVVEIKAKVIRDGIAVEIPVKTIVPGDVIILCAGNVVPGDCVILESNNLSVDEAVLTGETFPSEKVAGVCMPEVPIHLRSNAIFMGTHIVNGTAKALVVHTGKNTEFGKVSESLKQPPIETEFERGIRQFGYLLMEVTFLLLLVTFTINVFLARPVLDSLLFALALAVGLTPQLLPAIISVNLAHGAKRMAKEKVIVKRLSSIENLGSMDVLCSDKTGTLTEGTVVVQSIVNLYGEKDKEAQEYAAINAHFQTSYKNTIDEAILAYDKFDFSKYQKIAEVPYDFIRKRLSIYVQKDDRKFIVTKGALTNVLDVCSNVRTISGVVGLSTVSEEIQKKFKEFSDQGLRTLGIAYRELDVTSLHQKDEVDMTFIGFLLLFDPLQKNIAQTLERLKGLGITLKLITGDNALVAANISRQVGMLDPNILTGSELKQMRDDTLTARVGNTQVFAEVEPNQKERIIQALKRSLHVVGYIGDGINDVSALHAADVGISVENAVDVAKEAADIVLLEKNLAVLENGIKEGRVTFANTLKYIFMATSANFGNMFSMAGASLFLPFLPLLPTQVLLMNLLTDLPEMAIAQDAVDVELTQKPRRWDIGFIRRFMVTFGIISSVFDYITFAVLLFLLKANPEQFRTGWFLESVISASLIVLVVRTRKSFFMSKPGLALTIVTCLVVICAVLLPATPLAKIFGFSSLPHHFIPLLVLIITLYIGSAEIAKRWFYKKYS